MTTPKLVFRAADGRMTSLPLSAAPDGLRIGRDPDQCALCVRDPLLSAVHARVWREGDEWFVADCGSANHTYLNDDEQPVQRAALRDRDVIRCASLWVLCRLPPPPPLVAPAAPPSPTPEADGLRAQLTSLRDDRDQQRERARLLAAQLDAEEQMSATLRVDHAHLADELRQRDAVLATASAASAASDSALSALKVSERFARERGLKLDQRVQEAEQARDVILVQRNKDGQALEQLRLLLEDRSRALASLQHAHVQLDLQVRSLRDHGQEQAQTIAQLQQERDRLSDTQSQRRLALEQAEAELHQLREQVTTLDRLVNARTPEGGDLARLTARFSALQAERDAAQQREQKQRAQQGVPLLGIQSALLDLAERCVALQHNLGATEAPPRGAADSSSAEALEQMLTQIVAAQESLRRLRRVLGST